MFKDILILLAFSSSMFLLFVFHNIFILLPFSGARPEEMDKE
jgi:hypothetical protein